MPAWPTPTKVEEIQQAVSIPVMAKARIGHFVEAQILQALGVDYIDESEVLTPADEEYHIDKWAFTVPFVCGAREPGRGAPAHRRGRRDDPDEGRGRYRQRGRGRAARADDAGQIAELTSSRPERVRARRRRSSARRSSWCGRSRNTGELPVVNFAAGGLATPADAALMMQLGVDGVFVG